MTSGLSSGSAILRLRAILNIANVQESSKSSCLYMSILISLDLGSPWNMLYPGQQSICFFPSLTLLSLPVCLDLYHHVTPRTAVHSFGKESQWLPPRMKHEYLNWFPADTLGQASRALCHIELSYTDSWMAYNTTQLLLSVSIKTYFLCKAIIK